MHTIAIVDDDLFIGDMVEEVLEKAGYACLRAYSGTEAVLLFSQQRPDLILLDLMLPGLSGEEVLTRIQGIPVIVVSAKVDVEDKVKLLLGGAVDYVTKPFDTKELLARIEVQLRRANQSGANNGRNDTTDGGIHSGSEGGTTRDAFGSETTLCAGGLCLDLSTHEVRTKGASVFLTKTEYAILKLLMQNPGQVIAKSVILDRISLDTPDCTDSSLKQHVSNLRRKLREVTEEKERGDLSELPEKEYIEAVWGIGFRFV